MIVQPDAPDLGRNIVRQHRRHPVEGNRFDALRVAHLRAGLDDRQQIVGSLQAAPCIDQVNRRNPGSVDAGVALVFKIEANEFHML